MILEAPVKHNYQICVFEKTNWCNFVILLNNVAHSLAVALSRFCSYYWKQFLATFVKQRPDSSRYVACSCALGNESSHSIGDRRLLVTWATIRTIFHLIRWLVIQVMGPVISPSWVQAQWSKLLFFYSVTNEESLSLWDLLSIVCCAWNEGRAIRQLPEKLSVFSVLLAINVVGGFLRLLSCVVFYLRKSSTWRYVCRGARLVTF